LTIAGSGYLSDNEDLTLGGKIHDCHNDTNRLPTGSEICLENIPSPW
jgi:hypothetical protein